MSVAFVIKELRMDRRSLGSRSSAQRGTQSAHSASCCDARTGDTCEPAWCRGAHEEVGSALGGLGHPERGHMVKNWSVPTVCAHCVPGTEPGAWRDEKVCTKDQSRARLLESNSSQIAQRRGLSLGMCGTKVVKNVTSESTRLLASPVLCVDGRQDDIP